ncbi:NrtA/SsuA/CpmA family ABC transporter substrate-binding protein [Citricoccus alkalitolerans]|uniref:NrtA/SsuA/CpmA family ABC transporter substrate-binding protein n=1 Tax=Citricoccus alkalitolerans TaxID=246603 RepID=A0ABV8XXU8_9MICC
MLHHRLLAATGITAIAALTLTACTGEPTSDAAAAEDGSTVVTVATQRQPHLYAAYLYEQFGDAEGITFEVVPMANSTDELNALATGDVDFALMGVPTVISGVSQGQDVKLVASGADGGSGLIGAAGMASVEDLRGARIAHVPGSSQEIALRLTLEAAGIDPDSEVELVSLGYADMSDALARGDIDAYAGAEVNASISLLDGSARVASIYETEIGKVNIGLAVAGSLAEEDPELVQTVVDIHEQATEALREDEDAWIAGVQEQFSFDQAVLEQAAQNIWLRSDLSTDYVSQVEALGEQMVSLGAIDEAPAIDDVLTTEFVSGE